MKLYLSILLLAFALSLNISYADELPPEVHELVGKLYGGIEPDSVRESDIAGLYEVIMDGNVNYIDIERGIFVAGKIFKLSNQQGKKDISEKGLKTFRRGIVQQIDDQQTIAYAPRNKKKYQVYVFTDIDCGYCRKFHDQMQEINALGIQVNYLLTPYRGNNAYAKAIGVWCAKQQQATLDRAKQGKDIPLIQCENPIEQHLYFARKVGVTGTPAILLQDGTLLRGMRTPKQLLAELSKS